MTDDLWLQRRVNDLKIGFIFLTRLPLLLERPTVKGELSQALWAAPVVGAAVGLIGASVYGVAQSLHLPPLPAARSIDPRRLRPYPIGRLAVAQARNLPAHRK